MCGIVGAIAQRDVMGILVEGLRRLEYRGYDSSGVAIVNQAGQIERTRRVGKVQELAQALKDKPLSGGTGIAHTRWATHGVPSEDNAHPHVSGDGALSNNIAVVHNGIIENHQELREKLVKAGYVFVSQTDTEVIAHLVHLELQTSESLLDAVQKSVKQFEGAYGTVVLDSNTPEKIVVARSGSPLVIGLGLDENFIASDMMALLPVTRNFMFLEEGDVAQITRFDVEVYDVDGNQVQRESKEHDVSHEAGDKGEYRHFMMKEIFEQPTAVRNTLENGFNGDELNLDAFGSNAAKIFDEIEHVQIIACGTSYHSGMVARYWLESLANVSCNVEIASEFRYRKSFVPKKSLIVTLSQSGETADTLAALRLAKEIGYQSSLCVCNVDGSSLVRESDLVFLTKAGVEIGVASTKAFTTQLVGLLMMTVAIGRSRGMSEQQQKSIIQSLKSLPNTLESALSLDKPIELLAEDFADKHHSLFLGRGAQYPIAMEGALKLKEISYIHAEAYAAGELKHGPLALIDAKMPVIVVAPNNELLEKLKSNVEEVRARGGLMYVFADANAKFESDETLKVLNVVHCDDVVAPIVYTIPLQLLSYYVAIIKGTDVDQPRNLAKSVTVE
ncbi:MAG: glutamine--fructose-6-phosphate transaminase (isomerizing) [Saccharospirillaceae bacterium]|nr:glutamine--fructose-6-phosphate transaminase (isomerizing) [Saccharospirillaceae bacterium]